MLPNSKPEDALASAGFEPTTFRSKAAVLTTAPRTSHNSIVSGVKMNSKGDIVTDDFQATSASNIYAVGDVIGKWQLTPGKPPLT